MKSPALKLIVAAVAFAAAGAMAHGPGFGPGMQSGFGPCCSGDGPGMGGPGMGYGPGRGMGHGPFAANLTEEQRAKIAALQEEHRARNWKAMGELRNEQFKLWDLYASGTPDAAAVEAQQKKVDALREQAFRERQAMRSEIDAVLTPEQRKQRLQRGPWWARERTS